MKNPLSYFQKRPIKGSILFALLLGFLWVSISIFSYFTKVRDPADPRFDMSQFSFNGYGRNEIAYFMSIAFPPGTSKEFVESVLVDTGKAVALSNADMQQQIRYFYEPKDFISKLYPWTRNVGVLYDENNKVVETYVGPTPTHLMKEKP